MHRSDPTTPFSFLWILQHRVVISIFAIIILLAGFALASILDPEPEFHGKPLSKWLEAVTTDVRLDERLFRARKIMEKEGTNASLYVIESLSELEKLDLGKPPEHEALFAIRQIGAKALPKLIRDLKAKDSRLKLKIAQYLQREFAIDLRLHRADANKSRAVTGFWILGTQAKSAIPSLTKLIKSGGETAILAMFALPYLGPDSLPFLVSSLSNADPK